MKRLGSIPIKIFDRVTLEEVDQVVEVPCMFAIINILFIENPSRATGMLPVRSPMSC